MYIQIHECVCVCVKEREKEKERKRPLLLPNHTSTPPEAMSEKGRRERWSKQMPVA